MSAAASTCARPAQSFCSTTSLREPSSNELAVVNLALQRLSCHSQLLDPHRAFYALSWQGQYHLAELLIPGSFGVIIKAIDPHGTTVVIKIAKSQKFCATFTKESLALEQVSALAPHYTVHKEAFEPHLSLSDCGQGTCCNDRAALVTTYGGLDLYELYIERRTSITATDFIGLARSCMEFWSKLAACNQVLRDVKLENIVRDKQGTIRFLDLSEYGKQGDPAPTSSGTLTFSTPTFIHERLDSSEMPFAFGVTLFDVLTRHSLFPPNKPNRQAILIHLSSVFQLIGEPCLEFGASIPETSSFKYLFSPDLKKGVLHFIPLSNPTLPKPATLSKIKQQIASAINPENLGSPFELKGLPQEPFYNEFVDLLLKLLNFEHPLTPEQALAHPFFQLRKSPENEVIEQFMSITLN